MFKRNQDLVWTALGLALAAVALLVANRAKQPREVVLDLGPEEALSSEHQFVAEVLDNPETSVEPQQKQPSVVPADFTAAHSPLPTAGAPLPAVWERTPAPEAHEVQLSPALERSLAASSELRSAKYTDPNSEFNLQQIETLREIRRKRHEQQ